MVSLDDPPHPNGKGVSAHGSTVMLLGQLSETETLFPPGREFRSSTVIDKPWPGCILVELSERTQARPCADCEVVVEVKVDGDVPEFEGCNDRAMSGITATKISV